MMIRQILNGLFTAILVVAGAAGAQEYDGFERVLMPISVSGVPGAYGSVWATELWFRNNSGHFVGVFPVAVSDYSLSPGRTERLPVGYFPPEAPGQFIYVSSNGIDDVQFDLRLFNRSEPGAAWGTKLPVVREREFGPLVSLINVPTGGEFRTALRIYGLPDAARAGDRVVVEIYSHDERLLGSTELTFAGPLPYASILSLTNAFPQIRQVDRVDVRMQSRGGLAKIWAFVSVTSNATQNVAVVTPE